MVQMYHSIPAVQGQFIHHGEGFHADASDIGLRAGQWPTILLYEGVEFEKASEKWTSDGELMWIEYSSGEATFRVYND